MSESTMRFDAVRVHLVNRMSGFTWLARILEWRQYSVNRHMLGSMLVIVVLSALTRFAGAGRELIVAYRFGTSEILDAYLMAFLLPALVINVVIGAFSSALTPTFIDVRNNDGNGVAGCCALPSPALFQQMNRDEVVIC